MRYMNDYDIERASTFYANHPVLGPAVRQIEILRDYADDNSDGWCYWPKPARAAAKLMELIERDGTSQYAFDAEREDATLPELRKALATVKAFRTRELAAGRPGFQVVAA
jgi:phytoene/squalene synthetase